MTEERSFNDIAQDIIDAAPQVEPLVEEWFVTLSAVARRRDLREQGLEEQYEDLAIRADERSKMIEEYRDVNRDYAGRLEDALHELQSTKEQLEALQGEQAKWLAWSGGQYPDDSPGDVIHALSDGTITLDDGITTWNPLRALVFIERKREENAERAARAGAYPASEPKEDA